MADSANESLTKRDLMRMSQSRISTTGVIAAVVIAAVAASTVGCASSSPDSTSESNAAVTNCGRTVEVDSPIDKAVAVNQPAVELLLSLGLQDRMAGYAMSDDGVLPELEPARSRVEAFDTEFPSFETVLDREPDFVYATFDYTFTSEGIADRDKFTQMGVTTYQSPTECGGQEAQQTDALTLDDLYAEIEEIATLFDVQERGEELITSLRERASTATASLRAVDSSDAPLQDISLAWWYASTTTPYFAGCCGAPGLMTSALGATNVFADNTQYWPEIGWEAVFDRDPDVLVLADLDRGSDGDSAEAKIAFLESDPVASQLTAVKNRRYIVLEGTTMDPSIRNVVGTEQLADGVRRLGLAD